MINTSAAFGVFPYVLPARPDPALGLTIYNSATSAYGLKVGLAWWIPGMLLALGYFVFVYRHFAGKVRLEDGDRALLREWVEPAALARGAAFTGLRVGLAFAKGLGLALGRPCIGVGTLEALAASASGPGLT